VQTIDLLDIDGAPIFVGGIVRCLASTLDEPEKQGKHLVVDRIRVECIAADLPHLEAHRVLTMGGAPQDASFDEHVDQSQQRRLR